MKQFNMEAIGKLAVTLMVFVISLLFSGYIWFCFWDWFILPVFTALPAITYAQATGFSVFSVLFKSNLPKEQDEDSDDIDWVKIGKSFILQFLILIIGFVVASFIL